MDSTESTAEVGGSADGESRRNSVFESVRSVASGIAFDAVGKVAITLIGFLLNLVLAHGLGVALYGIYTYGRQIVMTVLLFANLGTNVANTKYVAASADDPARRRWVTGVSYATTFVVSLLVVVGLYAGAPLLSAWTLDDPQFVAALRLFAVGIPFYGMTKIAITTFRGLERPGYQTALQVLNPLSQLVAVGVAIALGAGLQGVVLAFVAATVAAFVISLSVVLWRTDIRPSLDATASELRDFFDFSLPYTLAQAGAVLYRRTDIFMIGILLVSSTAVGIYNVAVLLSTVVTMPLAGVNKLFPSVASRLHADDEYEVLESVYAIVTRWSITAALLVGTPIVLYRRTLLGLFGAEFVAGTTLLVVLVVGQFVNATAGPSNDLLAMTDHQYLVMANHWVFGVGNVALNFVLIEAYGVVGAALATATVLAGLNVVRVLEVWYLEGMFAYTRHLWKPVAAAGVAAVALLACRLVLSGIPLLVVGGTLGVAAFGLALLAFGVDERDREFVRRYVSLGDG